MPADTSTPRAHPLPGDPRALPLLIAIFMAKHTELTRLNAHPCGRFYTRTDAHNGSPPYAHAE